MPIHKSQRHYPRGFTQLIAEVADIAMKAIVEPDPAKYVERRSYMDRLDLIQFRRALSLESRYDPKRAALFRRDIARAKLVRHLALQALGAFRRMEESHPSINMPISALSLPNLVAEASDSYQRQLVAHRFQGWQQR